jgi:plastocyanin domain-containing protein
MVMRFRRLRPATALPLAFALMLLALAGCSKGSGPKIVRIAVTDDGFEPASVTVPRGRPATLVITRRTDATCATEAVFAETGRKVALPLGEDVRIPLATDAPGTLHFACGMDMYKGKVEIQ